MSPQVDHVPTRFLVAPIWRVDDVPLVRYTVQAAHRRRGAFVLVDVRPCRERLDQLAPIIEELWTTVEGNFQHFGILADDAEGLPERDGSLPPVFQGLGPLLEQCAPAEELPYAIELSLPSRPEGLSAVRDFLTRSFEKLHGRPPGFQLGILFDELCQNAVENSPSNESYFEAGCHVLSDRVVFEVTNIADDTIVPERIMQRRISSFDDSGSYLGERGRGLFLIARLADEFNIHSEDGGERITVSVTVHLDPEANRDSGAGGPA